MNNRKLFKKAYKMGYKMGKRLNEAKIGEETIPVDGFFRKLFDLTTKGCILRVVLNNGRSFSARVGVGYKTLEVGKDYMTVDEEDIAEIKAKEDSFSVLLQEDYGFGIIVYKYLTPKDLGY